MPLPIFAFTFAYDDKGFQHIRLSNDKNGRVRTTTTCVRDVAGNVLGPYESNYGNRYHAPRTEVPLYGAGHVGILTRPDATRAAREQQLGRYRGAVQQQAQQENERLTKAVPEEVNAYLKHYGKANGYTFLLGATDVSGKWHSGIYFIQKRLRGL